MVVANQVQRSVHDKKRQFVGEGLWRTGGDLGADHDVAEHRWLAIGHRLLADAIDREGEHIGRTAATHVRDIELSHLVFVDEGQPYFGMHLTMLGRQRGGEQLSKLHAGDFVRLLAVINVDDDIARTSRQGTTHVGSRLLFLGLFASLAGLAFALVVGVIGIDDGAHD